MDDGAIHSSGGISKPQFLECNLEKFEIFQIHDGRLNMCHLCLSVLKTGKVRLLGDYKIGVADGQNCDRSDVDVGDTVVKEMAGI